ncbi:MAG: adenosylmethionine decarboxylase [Candidatus Heimdallarchaeota archaeon]|nr:adenosylmethionine decarboxylase [Candidatus Heimdallarchaeota archaeon]MCK4290093.1 adenosylmethionine decarboxylase [Candidatus Heimdallarchaeota archaeon]
MPKNEIKKYPLMKPIKVNEILVDLYKCQADINNETALLTLVTEAAKKAGAHVLQASVHRFSPMGCSVIVILKETHISIHTWPEFGFAALDIFLCGESLDPYIAWNHIKEALKPETFVIKELPREIK